MGPQENIGDRDNVYSLFCAFFMLTVGQWQDKSRQTAELARQIEHELNTAAVEKKKKQITETAVKVALIQCSLICQEWIAKIKKAFFCRENAQEDEDNRRCQWIDGCLLGRHRLFFISDLGNVPQMCFASSQNRLLKKEICSRKSV